jgi:hypothetical protein
MMRGASLTSWPGGRVFRVPSFPGPRELPSQVKFMADTDTGLLDVLEAHGRQFLLSFKPHNEGKKERKRAAEGTAEPPRRSTKLAKTEADSASSSCPSSVDHSSDSAEEWTGFGDDARMGDEDGVHSSAQEMAPLEGVLCSTHLDDDRKNNLLTIADRMPIACRSAHKPDVVVFSGHGPKGSQVLSQRMQGKAFMVRPHIAFAALLTST